ncbi:hypothetical protein M3Y98_00793000 [Aphelenchoides besseyi]|nr:hypothetical protein M3Y98_00793000 [Aphelenchoides besseyi]KAI6211951.1 hypothetical protein M3Y96_00488700 [Aphelenchoides besseyi]
MVCKYQLCCSPAQFNVLSKLINWESHQNRTTIKFTPDGFAIVTFYSSAKRSFKFFELMKIQLFPALDEPLWRRISAEMAPLQLYALTFLWSFVNQRNGTFATPLWQNKAMEHYNEVDFFFKSRVRLGKRMENKGASMPAQMYNEAKMMQHRMRYLNEFDEKYKPIKMPWINKLPNELKFKILSKIVREPLFVPSSSREAGHIANLRHLLPLRGVDQRWRLLVEAWFRQTKQAIKNLTFVKAEFQKNGTCNIQLPKSHVRMRVNDSFFLRCFSLTNINNLNVHLDSQLEIQPQLDRLGKMIMLDGRVKFLVVYIEAKGTDFKVNDEVKAMFKRWKKQSGTEAIRLTLSITNTTEKAYSF